MNKIKEMQLKELNELAKEVSNLQDMVNDLFPRNEKLWEKAEKAAEYRFEGTMVLFDKYDSTIKDTFDERIALMLMQVLDIAHKKNVDLKFMIQSITNYRTTCKLNGIKKSKESPVESNSSTVKKQVKRK